MEITEDMFKRSTGRMPEQDDLDRCNCKMAGRLGHFHCGWSSFLNRPMFETPSAIILEERACVA